MASSSPQPNISAHEDSSQLADDEATFITPAKTKPCKCNRCTGTPLHAKYSYLPSPYRPVCQPMISVESIPPTKDASTLKELLKHVFAFLQVPMKRGRESDSGSCNNPKKSKAQCVRKLCASSPKEAENNKHVNNDNNNNNTDNSTRRIENENNDSAQPTSSEDNQSSKQEEEEAMSIDGSTSQTSSPPSGFPASNNDMPTSSVSESSGEIAQTSCQPTPMQKAMTEILKTLEDQPEDSMPTLIHVPNPPVNAHDGPTPPGLRLPPRPQYTPRALNHPFPAGLRVRARIGPPLRLRAPNNAAPIPRAPLPRAPVPNAPVPNAPVPNAPVPQAPLPHAPLPHAPLPHAPLPRVPAPSNPSLPNLNGNRPTTAGRNEPRRGQSTPMENATSILLQNLDETLRLPPPNLLHVQIPPNDIIHGTSRPVPPFPPRPLYPLIPPFIDPALPRPPPGFNPVPNVPPIAACSYHVHNFSSSSSSTDFQYTDSSGTNPLSDTSALENSSSTLSTSANSCGEISINGIDNELNSTVQTLSEEIPGTLQLKTEPTETLPIIPAKAIPEETEPTETLPTLPVETERTEMSLSLPVETEPKEMSLHLPVETERTEMSHPPLTETEPKETLLTPPEKNGAHGGTNC